MFQNAVNGVQTQPEDIAIALQLVDEWGRGFARNTAGFAASMKARGLDAVCAPVVVERLVRDTVLVTEWVDGSRLDSDASPDVPRLCGVALNAYLTMLLDTGLCILDWGMTLEVPSNLQYALLEFIAHLNVEDYDADFINLGFSPEGVSAERLKASGITDGLSFAFRQLSAGGGPKKIAERAQLASEGVDVKGVTNVMEEVSRRNRELFALPPYVLYVARAFSTLEGIGLSVDEDYAIVQEWLRSPPQVSVDAFKPALGPTEHGLECYPYLARRLFTDRSPRSKAALRAMLGLDGPAFREATAATATVDRGAGQSEATRELAGLLILEAEYDILVEESARLGDAAVRQALRTALVDTPASLVAPLGLKPPPALEALLAATDEDERALATASEIAELIGPRVRQELGAAASEPPLPTAVAEAVGSLLADGGARGDVWRGVQGVTTLSRRVGALMLRRGVQRAEGTPGLPAAAREAIINGNKAPAAQRLRQLAARLREGVEVRGALWG
ncbi:hypothetical protein EMIHUDRAFT_450128 [Emiliania huxleyi CCMP1516]|uniref:Uncharacterized protein n=2 Tax=Emiliania huxleyi TaxID=2903 RepID=A0A0D3JU67_EMIH1|nr:hypothetical protein EMIHUDRAFT_450128 [Emiliania huxleyi CCMP1516]EOD27052.1 hypothetical protein EMIHUDRAFT_450128 [Emiliania huxleyi CCMP1516]|eukprot:XP_005779481.1 hypothetical protein EMIHUDRAFT_450128 [Emiliania huxleyi CCMP1516]